jgi:aldose 1-epimerase
MKGDLRIEYSATTDKDTGLNLTNSSFLLQSGGTGTRQHPESPAHVAPIEKRIEANDDQLHTGPGEDHNWVLDSAAGKLAEATEVHELSSGRVLRVLSTSPESGFIAAISLMVRSKEKEEYRTSTAQDCLETQHFPDSPNQPNFPSTELKPGQRFHSVVFSFSAR